MRFKMTNSSYERKLRIEVHPAIATDFRRHSNHPRWAKGYVIWRPKQETVATLAKPQTEATADGMTPVSPDMEFAGIPES